MKAPLILLAINLMPLSSLCAQPAGDGRTCKPVNRAPDTVGCWILTDDRIGTLKKPEAYWHLDTYLSEDAAKAAKTPRSTLLTAFGKFWVLTVDDAPVWRGSGGEHVTDIGPLLVKVSTEYSAQYMQAIFDPGMTAPVHTHSGPEAWYTFAGETCLETPDGAFVGKAGGPPVIVPAGPPMHLTATGTDQRKSLVLILHDSAQPPTMLAHHWQPKGLCK